MCVCVCDFGSRCRDSIKGISLVGRTCNLYSGRPDAHFSLSCQSVCNPAFVSREAVRLSNIQHHQFTARQHLKLPIWNKVVITQLDFKTSKENYLTVA